MQRALISALFLCACGGGAAHEEAHAPVAPVAPPPPQSEPAPPGAIWREDVVEAIDEGLGYFLQRVSVQPEIVGGTFQGFRIVELRPAEWWGPIDLRPGDVVTSVNGLPIERETQAFAAFESLRSAEALRVAYRRGGEQRELVYRILDRESPTAVAPESTKSFPEHEAEAAEGGAEAAKAAEAKPREAEGSGAEEERPRKAPAEGPKEKMESTQPDRPKAEKKRKKDWL